MLETKAGDIAIKYHATMIDINRSLYVMGLINDELAERIAEKHHMAIFEILARKTGKSLEEILVLWKATVERD